MEDVVRSVSCNDPRIVHALAQELPHPVIVKYVDEALRANRGTLHVAKNMARLLARTKSLRTVNDQDAQRLGVHMDAEAMGRLSEVLLEVCPDALESLVILQIRLHDTIEYVPRGIRMFDELQKPTPLPPDVVRIDPEDMCIFQRIFLCALAMLVGVKTDPRSVAAIA